jgi:hypothetical protein
MSTWRFFLQPRKRNAMYLMDQIVETVYEAKKRRLINNPIISIFPQLTDKLKGCPRFLFDENTIHTAVELTLGRPKVLREAMQHLKIPYTRMWIEWPETGREKLRQTFSIDAFEHPNRPLPTRLGFLLETDEKGRKGMVTWVWSNHFIKKGEPPNVCPISPFFDLDFDYSQLTHPSYVKSFLDANLAHIWRNNKIQLDALLSIWNTAYHQPSEWGKKFLDLPALTSSLYENDKDRRVANFYADVYGEYIMIWSCLMLLTSSRKIVELEKIDMSNLNRIRRRMNKPQQLDHTMVTMYINRDKVVHQKGQPLGFERKSPRIHMVSRYLNRRGDKHWIVEPFTRGSGEIISRYVKVKGDK